MGSGDFDHPSHPVSTGDNQPLDEECADLDSACENQVCGAGK